MPTVRRTRPWTAGSKPPVSAQLRQGHPFASGLLAFWGLGENAGPAVDSGSNQLAVALASGAAWSPGAYGPGLLCNASSAGAQVNWPTALNVAWPITVIVAYTVIANQANSGLIFGLWPKPLAIYYNNSMAISGFRNSTDSYTGGLTNVIGATHVVACEQSSTTAGQFYIDGAAGSSSSLNPGAAAYSSTNVAFGDSTSFSGRTSGLLYHWGGVWNSVLGASTHALIGASPMAIFQMFQPARGLSLFPSAGAAAGFSAYFPGRSDLTPTWRAPSGQWITQLYG